jgi:hypothetical protein
MRLSLLRNNGKGRFADVTEKAGLEEPANSISASWCDYDGDGLLDLFVCCERQPSRLYRNRGNGTFVDVADAAGLRSTAQRACKGAAWIDYDNDDRPDLFLTYLDGAARLFRNRGDGAFENVTAAMGIDGPEEGFSCWAFDYDNDGWQDLFATNYWRSTADLVRGVLGMPYGGATSRLFRNDRGRRFVNVTEQAGLGMPYATMGSNFADFDGDGLLDFYLATGGPDYAMLAPNRMFRNVDGRRFSEVTGSTRTGHLQKGHSVACGDWDRDGDVDMFVEMGGAVPGDRYHNVMFQNPGHRRSSLTLKLVGASTNRSAIGARIRVVTDGPEPLTVHRHVSSGSSFGANPLQQTIGLGSAERVERLEVRWPAARKTQVFSDVPVNRAFELTEGSPVLRPIY